MAECHAPPTYYVLDKICDKMGLPTPPVRSVLEALRERGFEVSLTHFNLNGFKTNAPAKIVTKTLQEVMASERGRNKF